MAEGDSWQTAIGHFVSAGRCQAEAHRGARLFPVRARRLAGDSGVVFNTTGATGEQRASPSTRCQYYPSPGDARREHTHTHACAYPKMGAIPVSFVALFHQDSRNVKIERRRMNETPVLTRRHDPGCHLCCPSMAGGSRPVKSIQVRCHENTKLLCPFPP